MKFEKMSFNKPIPGMSDQIGLDKSIDSEIIYTKRLFFTICLQEILFDPKNSDWRYIYLRDADILNRADIVRAYIKQNHQKTWFAIDESKNVIDYSLSCMTKDYLK